ncbi:MAG: enoyl-CoA hydratase/isomerase family protein [Betaproteobacteria bacterium]
MTDHAGVVLHTEHADGVATLTLSRPERGNALSADLVEALLNGVSTALTDAAVHTVVLRGQGRHFCTGLDLSELDQARDGDLLWRLVRIETLLATLWHAPKCTVAVAQGRTWGAGADLFAACERRVALPGTTFRFPGAQFGIVLGTRRLALRMGAGAACAIVTQGGELEASEALACGLATHAQEFELQAQKVDALTAAALREATRAAEGADQRDADLAALVRSAARPGLQARVKRYVESLRAAGGGGALAPHRAASSAVQTSTAAPGPGSTREDLQRQGR